MCVMNFKVFTAHGRPPIGGTEAVSSLLIYSALLVTFSAGSVPVVATAPVQCS